LHLYQIWESEHENLRKQISLLNPDSDLKRRRKEKWLILFADGSSYCKYRQPERGFAAIWLSAKTYTKTKYSSFQLKQLKLELLKK